MKKKMFRTLLIFLLIVTIPFPCYADYGNIRIDGYYDDWEDKPHTEVYNGENPKESKINSVSLFRDEKYAYVHVIFGTTNNQATKNMRIELFTDMGDKTYVLGPDWFDWPEEMESNSKKTESLTEQEGSLDLEAPVVEQEESLETSPAEPEDQAEPQNDTENSASELFSAVAKETVLLIADNENKEGGQDSSIDTAEPEEPSQLTGPTEPSLPTEPSQPTEPSLPTDTSLPAEPTLQTGVDEPAETDENNQSSGDDPIMTNPENPTDEDQNLPDPGDNLNLDELIDPEIGPYIELQQRLNDDEELSLDKKTPGWDFTWTFDVYDYEFPLFPVGTGYYTMSLGEPDELELRIALSSITRHYDGITEISMRIKKLGQQTIICVGASSEPYVGVAVGAGIAILSAGAFAYKKKRPGLLK